MFRDLVWSPFADSDKSMQPYLAHLRDLRTSDRKHHVSWYNHLYMADWIGALIVREMHECSLSKDGFSPSTRQTSEMVLPTVDDHDYMNFLAGSQPILFFLGTMNHSYKSS